MLDPTLITRRGLMRRSLAFGCSIAASPFVTPVALASAPWENRLVVILLRGGMDGLDVVRPVGDPTFARLRPASKDTLPLDGFFGMHPQLVPFVPLWEAGELAFAHAVSTPYRDKRSHFDGQDLLEAGTNTLSGARDGWLNRLLQTVPGAAAETAFALGNDDMIVLHGDAPTTSWTPDADVLLSPQALLLADLVMQTDPAFAAAFKQAVALADADGDPVSLADLGSDKEAMEAEMAALRPAKGGGSGPGAVAAFAGARLREETRIAAFSIGGWDTHRRQEPNLARALGRLSEAILALRDAAGPDVWSKTAVLAVTEFGRTAQFNGSGGTDHGTGGAMLYAGGALRGSRVISDWPGLDEADLYQRRDLMPTRDVRAHAGWAMRHLFGLDATTLETRIFPGLDLGADPAVLA